MTTAINTRAGLSRALTHGELDANFENLRGAIDSYIESSSGEILALQEGQPWGGPKPSNNFCVAGNLGLGGATYVRPWARSFYNVEPFADATLNALGLINFWTAENLGADEYPEYTLIPEDVVPIIDGMWLALSVYIHSSDATTWGTNHQALLYDDTGGQHSFLLPAYEQVTANIRKYRGVFQVSGIAPHVLADIDFFVRIPAGRTATVRLGGYALGVSKVRISGVVDDWSAGQFLNPETTLQTVKDLDERVTGQITAAETTLADIAPKVLELYPTPGIARNMCAGGMLPSSNGTSFVRPWARSLFQIEPFTDATLNALGLFNFWTARTLAAAEQPFYTMIPSDPSPLEPGDYVAFSAFIHSDDAAGWGTNHQVYFFDSVSGGTSAAATVNFTQVNANVRKYYGVARVPDVSPPVVDIDFYFLAPAGRSSIIRIGGYSVAVSKTAITGVTAEWGNDPLHNIPALVSEVASINNTLETLGIQSADPVILYPGNLFLVAGRPLPLYGNNIFTARDQYYRYRMAVKTLGPRPAVKPFQESIDLLAEDMGATLDICLARPDSTVHSWRRPVTVHTSSATKTGSPKILIIGDSLTYQGTAAALNAKLVAAGVTPEFVGTYQTADVTNSTQTGVFAEGRPGWETSDFTYRKTAINGDGTGQTFPVPIGDEVLRRGDYYYNPFLRAATGGDPPGFVYNGYIFDVAAYLSRFGLNNPDLVIIALGTNDIASNDVPDEWLATGLNIIWTQVRAALPAAKIAVLVNQFPVSADSLTQKGMPAYQAILQDYDGAANTDVLPVYAHQNADFVYAMSDELGESGGVGVIRGDNTEWVHSDRIGREQWAEVQFAWVMNQI
jgi:hypothetical protein